ncbi:MAG TPA: hypothetical protein VHE11_16130 [Steroidobacteraceae bacterium]|nr:hypothetical protein [Steroidobacteraceae bacterium]
MRALGLVSAGSLCAALLVGSCCPPASAGAAPPPTPAVRDGQHDFDFELGTWKFHVRKLVHPLSGSQRWIELDGTSRTCRIWNGRAQLEQAEVRGAAGSIEGLTLRLYNPRTGQWSLYWATSKAGALAGPPNVGRFTHGVGRFYSWDSYDGRYVLIRYVWSRITPGSAHFEQSFSDDGGRTWEVNWITDQTRIGPAADCAGATS